MKGVPEKFQAGCRDDDIIAEHPNLPSQSAKIVYRWPSTLTVQSAAKGNGSENNRLDWEGKCGTHRGEFPKEQMLRTETIQFLRHPSRPDSLKGVNGGGYAAENPFHNVAR